MHSPDLVLPHCPKGLWGIAVAQAGGRAGGRQGRQNPISTLNFSPIIFKRGKDIYFPAISDEFDYGGPVWLHICIMAYVMTDEV